MQRLPPSTHCFPILAFFHNCAVCSNWPKALFAYSKRSSPQDQSVISRSLSCRINVSWLYICLVSLGVAQQDTSSAADERRRGLPPLRNNGCHGPLQTRRLPASGGTSTKETETDRHWRINKYRSIQSFKGTLSLAYRGFPPASPPLSAELIWHIWNKEDRVSGLHSSEHFVPSCVFMSAAVGVMLRSEL